MSKQFKPFVPKLPEPKGRKMYPTRHVNCDLGSGDLPLRFMRLREKYDMASNQFVRQMIEYCIEQLEQGTGGIPQCTNCNELGKVATPVDDEDCGRCLGSGYQVLD